jgi:hypothetical protein
MIAEHLLRQSVAPMESTIPPHMTIEQWRRLRSPGAEPKRRYSARVSAGVRRVVSLRAVPCDHLHESTTRYDQEQKVLTFLLVCPVCGTEKVMETQLYEPRFEPSHASRLANASGGATIHQLPVRRHERPMRRAA